MRIEPLTEPLAHPTHEEGQRTSRAGDETSARTRAWKEKHAASLAELNQQAQQANLEVRLHTIPGTNTIILRFVDPATGNVVQEFPSERLARAIDELRTQSLRVDAATSLDRRA